MNKNIFILISVVCVIFVLGLILKMQVPKGVSKTPISEEINNTKEQSKSAELANPASTNCVDNGGNLEMITNTDGSQFGLCTFKDYSCEEWAYYRGECNIKEDSDKIYNALLAKGLNLTGMKVVIYKHLGKYIEAGVVPVSEPAGGGYVFAVKNEGTIKIVADGNGVILCSVFNDYPNFPTFLVSSCVDEQGNLITR